MWISRRKETRQTERAQVGNVTVEGRLVGAMLDGERRDLPVYGPGGYVWRPSQGQEVLVVKAGADGEQPCVAGARGSLEVNLAPGEGYIHSGGGSIFISNGGGISMSGLVLVNGKPVLVKED